MGVSTDNASAGGSETNGNFSADMESLKKNFGQLRADLTQLVGTALGAGKTGAGALREKAHSAVDGVKHGLEGVRDRGSESIESLEKKIAERPLTSALIALGVGYMLGRLFSRR
jgi:ElaB/YqjD/DUF883 family membrane-anchored ribosome-binding protein